MILWLEKRGSDRRLLDLGHDNSGRKIGQSATAVGRVSRLSRSKLP